jgi:hypothetical protein
MAFASIPEALEEISAGRMLVVVDDEDRENEGDLTIAAAKTTPEIINFMATHGRGLICLTLTPDYRYFGGRPHAHDPDGDSARYAASRSGAAWPCVSAARA